MSHYEITISGKTFSFDGPPGLTQEQARDIVRHKISPTGATEMGKDVAQFGLGVGEGLIKDFPVTLAPGGPAARAWRSLVHKAIPSLNRDQGPNQPENIGQEYARTSGEFVGNPASYAGGIRSGASATVGKIVDALTAALGSETMHQLAEAGQLNPIISSIMQGAGGMLGPAIRNIGAEGGPRLRHTDPHHEELVQTLREFGVEPTAGAVKGSTSLMHAEGTLGQVFGSFGAYDREFQRVGNEFANAALRLMGDTTTDMRQAGSDFGVAIGNRRGQLQGEFETVARVINITHDRQIGDQLTNVLSRAQTLRLPPADIDQLQGVVEEIMNGFVSGRRTAPAGAASGATFQQRLNNIVANINAGSTGRDPGRMSGDTYQRLTQHSSALSRMQRSENSNLAFYADQVREALDDAMERTVQRRVQSAFARGRSGGQAQAQAVEMAQALDDLQAARREWWTMIVLSRAHAAAGKEAAHGRITPAQLRSLVTSTDDDKIQYALQRSNGNDLMRLARAGVGVLSKMPNSTTAERGLATHAAETLGNKIASIGAQTERTGITAAGGYAGSYLGPLGVIPGLMTPGLTGRAILSPRMQRWLKRERQPGSASRLAGPALGTVGRVLGEPEYNYPAPPGEPAIGRVEAAPFKPIDPSNPSYTDPGAHARPSNVENPARAAPKTSVPPRYRESSPNAKYYQPWTKEELDMAEAGQVPPGRTANQMHRQRQLQGFAKPRTEEEPPLESQPGFAEEVLGAKPGARPIPRITVQALPPEQRSPETVLDNPEGDPLQ